MLTIGEIFDMMRKEFEDIKKKQKEIKETSVNISEVASVSVEVKQT
jgi:hypothetical protein